MLTEFPVVVSLCHIQPLLYYYNEMGGTELYVLKVMSMAMLNLQVGCVILWCWN